jgi:hypothetical protein
MTIFIRIAVYTQTFISRKKLLQNGRADAMKRSCSDTLRSSLEKPHTLTLALSPQGRGNLRITPPLRGGDKGEGV